MKHLNFIFIQKYLELVGKLKCLFMVCVLVLASSAFAQDDDLMELVEPESQNENLDEGSQKPQLEGASGSTQAPASASVTDAEIEKLVEASKQKSEPSLLKAASEILSKDASNIRALNALGIFYFQSKKFGLAKIIFKRALKDHPNEPALHNNLGIVYLAENDLELAIDSLSKSVQAKEDYPIGAINLSSIYLEYRDYQRGLSALEVPSRSMDSDLRRGKGEAVEIANNYAVALMGVGEKDKAGEVFEKIYKSSSQQVIPILNYLTLLVEVEKNKKDAMKVISKLKSITDDQDVLQRADELVRKLE